MIVKRGTNPHSLLRPHPKAPPVITPEQAIANELKMRAERGQKPGDDFTHEPASKPVK